MDRQNGDDSRKPLIELFIRASSIERTEKGATPFCQQWFIAFQLLAEKDLINLLVTTVNLDDPPAAYEALNVTRRLPVCRVVRGFVNDQDHTGHVCETNDEIETLLESFQCESLRMSKAKGVYEERRRAERVFEDMYRHLGQFLRTPTDNGALLLTDLRRLNDYLEEKRTRFILSDEPSFVDCVLMPRLQHVRVAAAGYKQLIIPPDYVWLWRYMANMYNLQAFISSCPSDRDVLLVYEGKHSVQPVVGSPKFMPPVRTVDIPDAVLALLAARQRNEQASD
jgi:chloride intracellular channel protein 2